MKPKRLWPGRVEAEERIEGEINIHIIAFLLREIGILALEFYRVQLRWVLQTTGFISEVVEI